MTSEIRHKQKEYSQTKSDEDKKILGQYFTDSPIAQFMSSLIDDEVLNPDKVKLLDCGAGHGILTVSTAFHLLNKGINNIDATLYEIDEQIISNLSEVLEELKAIFAKEKKIFNYNIINDDFVTLRPDLNTETKYDLAVINPPYFKYSVKESIYAKKTTDLFKGDPNIYASFVAITLSALEANGQLVAITPRSFLNGLYFKGFRKYLLDNALLELIHIFKSRKEVFTDSDILQENVIFKLIKNGQELDEITISSCNNITDLNTPNIRVYPKDIIIDTSNNESIIRIPETEKDFQILQQAERLPSTFEEEGYFISTGPVVEHRTKEYLTSKHSQEKQVPLIKAHNVFINGIIWNGNNKKDISFNLLENFEKHLVPNIRYVILKRFTSKDENRRLVAGVYIPIRNLKQIGITNKLNYIGRKNSTLSEEEANGLSILFNSTFMDDYYRCISGNTQVNATDIRIMKIPTREQIIQLGKHSSSFKTLEYDTIEKINEILND
ncbi:adenine-specific DNA-methyltransferase [Zhouia amylolytica]|uniref:site-specific DNA-methyltransferase (adenine-specific) n=1 Tax=Zhouia amylolytica TaxID=376730 RepID=A0A1I6T3F4_9FLAO|nr:Eco57I restriction-modification methylase domain-containing protein [Zhouia amylolytica]SFS83799.1 adenine-specific DNA-methyltransferase [Zhouia amylolytica]